MFVDNNDGTITDTQTNLIWQKEYHKDKTHDEAISLQDDVWRLPTIEELISLIDYGKVNPASTFLDMPRIHFWSSSSFAHDSSYAWIVYFSYGYVYGNSRYYDSAVRLVRSKG